MQAVDEGGDFMKFLFKQRLFSWFDSYDIYDEAGNPVYIVRGQLAWGHCLKIFDAKGHEPGVVKERVIAVLPWFEIYEGDRYIGCIRKELTLLKPKYDIDYLDWHVEGNLTEWDYEICGPGGETVAQKESVSAFPKQQEKCGKNIIILYFCRIFKVNMHINPHFLSSQIVKFDNFN